MNRVIVRTVGLLALVAVAAPAMAGEEDAYGKPEDAAPCQGDDGFAHLHRFYKEKVKPECAAEIEKRIQLCLKDPEQEKIFKDPKYTASKDPEGYCGGEVVRRVQNQLEKYAETQKEAKQAEADKAKVAAQRMPKADMHNAQIEKSIANTFHQAFPDHKIIKVIITDKSWDYEKDAFGRVTGRDINASVVNKHPDGTCEIYSEMWVQQGNGKSYKGPFEERGAGSLEKAPILCENAK